jgi:hypothetical protein
MALQILYVCARGNEQDDSDYVLAPLLARLTRALGEMTFIFLALMSVPVMLMTWISGAAIMRQVEWLEGGNVFFAGVAVLLVVWGVGLLALMGTRFMAECVFAFFSMADDLSVLRKKPNTL